MLHLVSGTNPLSFRQSLWFQFRHFLLTYSFTHHFFLFCFTTLLIHSCLPLSITPGLKPTCFINPTPLPQVTTSSLPDCLHAWRRYLYLFITIQPLGHLLLPWHRMYTIIENGHCCATCRTCRICRGGDVYPYSVRTSNCSHITNTCHIAFTDCDRSKILSA